MYQSCRLGAGTERYYYYFASFSDDGRLRRRGGRKHFVRFFNMVCQRVSANAGLKLLESQV